MEHILAAENTGIFGIEAEYESDAENVQPAERFGRGVAVLFQQCIVYACHYLACLH